MYFKTIITNNNKTRKPTQKSDDILTKRGVKDYFYGDITSWQQAERQTMEYNKYKIEDINIGDEIYFDSVPSQSNFDEYWTVHGKDKKQVLVNLKKEHYWTVKISEVRQHIKKPMNDNKS